MVQLDPNTTRVFEQIFQQNQEILQQNQQTLVALAESAAFATAGAQTPRSVVAPLTRADLAEFRDRTFSGPQPSSEQLRSIRLYEFMSGLQGGSGIRVLTVWRDEVLGWLVTGLDDDTIEVRVVTGNGRQFRIVRDAPIDGDAPFLGPLRAADATTPSPANDAVFVIGRSEKDTIRSIESFGREGLLQIGTIVQPAQGGN
jgi:hypothetical protein